MAAVAPLTVTASRRRLATLASLFAPARAAALLRRAGPDGGELETLAASLARMERGERLRALEAALESDLPAARRARAAAQASTERPAVAAALLATGGAAAVTGPVAPILARLLRERLAA